MPFCLGSSSCCKLFLVSCAKAGTFPMHLRADATMTVNFSRSLVSPIMCLFLAAHCRVVAGKPFSVGVTNLRPQRPEAEILCVKKRMTRRGEGGYGERVFAMIDFRRPLQGSADGRQRSFSTEMHGVCVVASCASSCHCIFVHVRSGQVRSCLVTGHVVHGCAFFFHVRHENSMSCQPMAYHVRCFLKCSWHGMSFQLMSMLSHSMGEPCHVASFLFTT